jgi:hypothetical protein
MVQRLVGLGRVVSTLERADDWLLRHVPALQRFCRYMILTLRRDG